MDYYKDYIKYASEIDEACSCVNSNRCSSLNADIEAIATVVNGLNLSSIWPDGVGGTFKSVIETTKGCLKDISSSISSLFAESEEIYLDQKEQLSSLKDMNTRYMNKRDNEKPSTDDYEVSAEYENGVLVKEGYFRQSDYDSAIADWRRKVQELEDKCIDLKNEIEKNKTKLSEINSETVMSSGNFSTLEMRYGDVLNVSPNSILAIATANGISLLTYSNWGEDFYVLVDITGGDPQEHNMCLEWANGYAVNMLMQSNNSVEYRNRPIAYTSRDKQQTLSIAASELLEGRPVVVEVQGMQKGEHGTDTFTVIKNGVEVQEEIEITTRHYVTIYGIRQGANLDDLQESDFLYLDPAAGEIKQLNTTNGGTQQRDLLPGVAAFGIDDPGYYSINVFSDNDYSTLPDVTIFNDSGMIQAPEGWTSEVLPIHDVNYSNGTETHNV